MLRRKATRWLGITLALIAVFLFVGIMSCNKSKSKAVWIPQDPNPPDQSLLDDAVEPPSTSPAEVDLLYTDTEGTTGTIKAYEGQVIVVFDPTAVTPEDAEQTITDNSGVVAGKIPNVGIYFVETSSGSEMAFITALRAASGVISAEPDVPLAATSYTSNPSEWSGIADPSVGAQSWYYVRIEADKAWGYLATHPPTTTTEIAFIDDGFADFPEADFSGRLINTPASSTSDHGTLVALAAAAAGNNSSLDHVGVDWKCHVRRNVCKLKGFSALWHLVSNTAKGAEVINLSYGPAFNSQLIWKAWFVSLKSCLWTLNLFNKDKVLCVWSAGNAGLSACNGSVPSNLIVVGATAQDDSRWTNSNHGTAVELYAPGVNICVMNNIFPVIKDGTSLSAPLVSGTASLIWSVNPNLTAAEVKQILLDGATTIAAGKLVNAYASVLLAGESSSFLWSCGEDMPTGRVSFGTVEVNGKIYAIGGGAGSGYDGFTNVEEYDLSINSWSIKTDMPTGRNSLCCAAVNGKIYAIGGYKGGYFSTVEEYDPIADSWTPKASMPAGRAIATASTVNGKIYVIGGYNTSSSDSNKVGEYDPVLNSWTTKANMPTARHGATAAVLNGKIYVIGGITNTPTHLNIVELYDPAVDTWTTVTPMPIALTNSASAVVNGRIYVIGGSDAGSVFSTVQIYDPIIDTWTIGFSDMPTARSGGGSCTVNEKIYVVGGNDGVTEGITTLEIYDPF